MYMYNYVLLKMSTWYSKHVEESNNIWRINNIQCITLVVLYGHLYLCHPLVLSSPTVQYSRLQYTVQLHLYPNIVGTFVYQAKHLLASVTGGSKPSVYIIMKTKCSGHISSTCRPSQLTTEVHSRKFQRGTEGHCSRSLQVWNTPWATDKGNDSPV